MRILWNNALGTATRFGRILLITRQVINGIPRFQTINCCFLEKRKTLWIQATLGESAYDAQLNTFIRNAKIEDFFSLRN